jgi:hypothetical protein
MDSYGISASTIFSEFFVREGLCDRQRARQLASKLDREIRDNDRLETEDGASFVRTRCRYGSGSRQLGFGRLRDVDERSWDDFDPISMTSRREHAF